MVQPRASWTWAGLSLLMIMAAHAFLQVDLEQLLPAVQANVPFANSQAGGISRDGLRVTAHRVGTWLHLWTN